MANINVVHQLAGILQENHSILIDWKDSQPLMAHRLSAQALGLVQFYLYQFPRREVRVRLPRPRTKLSRAFLARGLFLQNFESCLHSPSFPGMVIRYDLRTRYVLTI